jgi:toxin CcdB
MAQFDLYKNPRGGTYALLLDVQADLMAQLETRVVVPLVRRDRYKAPPVARAIPSVIIDGVDYVLVVPLLAAVSKTTLAKAVGSLRGVRADVIAAHDLLFSGS